MSSSAPSSYNASGYAASNGQVAGSDLSMSGVHWHEGQFLQPHHFQAMQRQHEELLASERQWMLPYPYGLIEIDVSSDALANWRVEIRRLRAVLPSGHVIDVPRNADLPPLDLHGRFNPNGEPMLVSLALPSYHAGRANTVGALAVEESSEDDLDPPEFEDESDLDNAAMGDGGDETERRMWRVRRLRVADENTGDNPQPILVRRLNVRLLTEGEDSADYEVLPIMRVAAGSGGVPIEDRGYMPPCLSLSGCPRLRRQVTNLAELVEASRKKLVRQMARENFNFEVIRGSQFEQQVRLRTLNRYAARLQTLVSVPNVSPLTMYLELRELLAEMSARFPERDAELSAVPPYRHDDPAMAFAALEELLRPLLGEEVREMFRKVDADKASPADALLYRLHGRDFKEPDGYYLGITQTGSERLSAEDLAALVTDPNGFKVMSERFKGLAIYGVPLVEERRPDERLPPGVGNLTYFRMRLDEDKRRPRPMWPEIAKDKVLAVRYRDMERLQLGISLFMTIPEDAGKRAAARSEADDDMPEPPTPTVPRREVRPVARPEVRRESPRPVERRPAPPRETPARQDDGHDPLGDFL